MPFNFKESPLPGSKAPETGGVKPKLPFRSSVFAVESDATTAAGPDAAPIVFEGFTGEHLPEATWVVPWQVEKLLDANKK